MSAALPRAIIWTKRKRPGRDTNDGNAGRFASGFWRDRDMQRGDERWTAEGKTDAATMTAAATVGATIAVAAAGAGVS